MEWVNAIAVVAAGLLLRFGIPFGLTILLTLALRRLDARWQEEARRRRSAALSLGAGARAVRCWEEQGCPPEKREACRAYTHEDLPCWQVFRQSEGRLPERCLECTVFKSAPVPMQA